MGFFKTMGAVFLAQLLLVGLFIFGLFIVGIAASGGGDEAAVADDSYLIIDIYGEVLAYDPPETFISSVFGTQVETVHRILSNLEKVTVDDRIKGVVVKVSGVNTLGGASIEEIRHALGKVRESGKATYAFSDNLNRGAIYLASACDTIVLSPAGNVSFTGMGLVREYYRGTLDKLGVSSNIHKIERYKSAAEMTERKDMSPEAEEMARWMLDDFWEMQLGAISEDRGIPVEKLVEDMDHVLFTPQEAVEAGFVDMAMYWSDFYSHLKYGEDDLETVSQKEYAKVERSEVGLKGKHRIAVVHAHGMIGGRKSRVDPYVGMLMGHETVTKALRDAADNDKIDAIVFRIDSNGGESLASDIIAHEVGMIAQKKPVIVSMMDVAASGGYTIAYKGTKVVADEMTITGSIGSIYGKFNTVGMWNKIGVTFDWVTKGPNALFWAGITDFTDEQRKRFVEHHYDGYNAWIEDIAQHRDMEVDELKKIAGGRVWTGRQAKENGLIDEIGGLDRAIELAKEEAAIPADEEVSVLHYPKKKGFYAMLTSGQGPFGIANWMAYQLIHHELNETARILSDGGLRMYTGGEVR